MNVYAVTDANGDSLSKSEIDNLLKEIGISAEAIEDGSSDAIEQDAEKNDINLNQLTSLASKQGTEVNGATEKAKDEFESELKALGIPLQTIDEGKEAVEAYAKTNGITLPQPPSGAQFNALS